MAGQIVAGLIVALTLMYNKHVLIRLTEAEATQAKYEIVEHLSKTAEGQENMVHARALSTNVPFFKGNVFDYSKLLGWMGEGAKKLTPLYILIT